MDRLLCELEAEKERQRGFAELQAKLEEAEEMVADLLTKPLSRGRFETLRKHSV